MRPVVALPAELLVTMRWVEIQSAEMVLESMQIHRRRMVSPTLVVVAEVHRTELAVVEVQELSLFVIQFQPHRLFRLYL
jgi:hypothetical protein